MDRAFIDLLDRACGKNTVLFSIGHNTTFMGKNDTLTLRYETESGQLIEHKLMSIEQLAEGEAPFESIDENWMDKYLPLLMAIETAIDSEYMKHQGLKDKIALSIIEKLLNRPDMKLESELVNAIQANMRLVLSTTKYSRKEVMGCLKKVQRSIKRHHSLDGPTGYLDFIRKNMQMQVARGQNAY